MESLVFAGVVASVTVVALFAVGVVLSRLYRRASKETAFVKTGLGGARVIMDGGALVLPVFHGVVDVSLKTHKLVVKRTQQQALITNDKLRADVEVEFYVRVKKDSESVQAAAQTLGARTNDPDALKELVEGKFVDALRSVAAGMKLEELHLKRADFVQKVRESVSEDLAKNGLELESASLVGLDQTDQKFFNPDNAFDAEGLKRIKEITEAKRKERFDIEATTNVAIAERDREQTKARLEIERETETARLDQERSLAEQRAATQAQVAAKEAEGKRQAEVAQIEADRAAKEARVEAERSVQERQIEREKTLQLRRQESEAAVAEQSKAKSAAEKAAADARAEAAAAEERVRTAAAVEVAEREKRVKLVKASEDAEREALAVTVAARADREAAEARATAKRTEAEAQAAAEKLLAEALAAKLEVEAEGARKLTAAKNTIEERVVGMEQRLRLIDALPAILAAATKPLERIESIKVVDVAGIGAGAPAQGGGGEGHGPAAGAIGLAEQVVSAALRHRVQAPVLDALLGEIGVADAGSLRGLMSGLDGAPAAPGKAAPKLPAPSGA